MVDSTLTCYQTSNIADHIYLGIADTIASLSPLLQKPSENRHATFITLFMNVMGQLQARGFRITTRANMRHAMSYLGLEYGDLELSRSSSDNPKMLMINDVASGLCDGDYWFQK